MIGIALLAIASGALFWRLNRMVERKRFDSDINRLSHILVSARSLSINTKMDFQLVIKESKEGWNMRLICREDPDLIYPLPSFSAVKICFDQKPVQEFAVDFFSSGFVGPKGLLKLSNGPQKWELRFPEFFYRQEESPIIPLHSSEIKES